MDNAELAVATLTALRETGVRISIDDFGTGYSSLSRLNRFPVDILKIDQSFVAGLPDDSYDTALIGAVLAIAGSLNLSVVAEGVENRAQARTLLELGCQCAQGYHFYRPLTAEHFKAAMMPKVRCAPVASTDRTA
jgi:EAL domain-containing protein (putative c-di-GMP-specific phosphodiesterase class I)